MDHPQLYSDTDPRAMAVWLDLLRKMPAGDKLKVTLELSRFALQLSEMGVRLQHPQRTTAKCFYGPPPAT